MLRAENGEAKETWDWEGKKEERGKHLQLILPGGPTVPKHTHTHPGQTADFEMAGLPAV